MMIHIKKLLLRCNFTKSFYMGFCVTTHKSQGSTFNFQYTIHEWSNNKLFNKRAKYVALSRATKKEFINIVGRMFRILFGFICYLYVNKWVFRFCKHSWGSLNNHQITARRRENPIIKKYF